MSKLETVVFVPDTHVPYHSEDAWNLFLKCTKVLRPNRLYFLGDFGDFYCTNRHPKDPRRSRDLKVEIDANNEKMDEVQRLRIPNVHYCLGNHENNLERYLSEKAPELFNLISVPELFRFKQRKWSWSEYGDIVTYGKLHIVHDQDFCGRNAHEQTRAAIGGNVIIGHSHRLSVNYNQTLLGEGHVAVMSGWLGDPKYATYMKPSKRKDWFHGFTIGRFEDNGNVHLQIIPFIQGTAVIDGRAIRL